jgi:ribonuclease HI
MADDFPKPRSAEAAAAAADGPVRLVLFADGACRGNPGPAGCGVVIKDDSATGNNNNKKTKPVLVEFARKVGPLQPAALRGESVICFVLRRCTNRV